MASVYSRNLEGSGRHHKKQFNDWDSKFYTCFEVLQQYGCTEGLLMKDKVYGMVLTMSKHLKRPLSKPSKNDRPREGS